MNRATIRAGVPALLRGRLSLYILLLLTLLLVWFVFGVHTWNTPFRLFDTTSKGSVPEI
jgi:hypothetical protein